MEQSAVAGVCKFHTWWHMYSCYWYKPCAVRAGQMPPCYSIHCDDTQEQGAYTQSYCRLLYKSDPEQRPSGPKLYLQCSVQSPIPDRLCSISGPCSVQAKRLKFTLNCHRDWHFWLSVMGTGSFVKVSDCTRYYPAVLLVVQYLACNTVLCCHGL